MASLDTLPPPQRAVLSLILAKGKTYDEIAGLLGLEVAAVRERAHLALDALAPREGARPAPRHRAAIGNYLLGQQLDAAATTFAYLESSVAGRGWARALARALEPLADGRLPPIPADPDLPTPPAAAPAEPPAAASPPPARPPETAPQEDDPPAEDTLLPAPAVSRRGGALLIGGAVLVLAAGVVAAVLLFTGGAGHKPTPKPAPAATATTPQATLAGQITLTPAPGTAARGLAAVFARAARRGVAIAASGLRPTSAHVAYGVWLYNTPTDSQLVGFLPAVKADGRVSAFADIPTGAVRFRTLVLTREASSRATTPGQILLSGTIPARALG